MWWWGVCAGASCCSDVVQEKRTRVYDDLRLLMMERTSCLSPIASRVETAAGTATQSTTPPGLYTARHRMNHEIVALKVFNKKILKRKDTRRRLRREIKILSLCRDHPNLLTLHGVYTSSATFEIAFELARGGEVMNRIHTDGAGGSACVYRFSECEVSRVLAGVVDGLRFLHEHEVVHGEVRPEHILYSDTEPDSRVLLADFGRAATWNTGEFTFQSRIMSGDTNNTKHKNKRSCGTTNTSFLWDDAHNVKFLPPFALQRKDDALRNWSEARQVDIWALGVTMYVLLCASFPFDGGDALESTQQSVLQDRLEFPQGGAMISRAARDLLQRLLEKDPDDVLTMDEVSMHPWIQENCASGASWSGELIDAHRAFATRYTQEVAAVSRRRRVSDAAYSYSLRACADPTAPLHRRKSNSSNSESGEYRDRYSPSDGEDDSEDETNQHERPSFVSTSGNRQIPLLVADEPPTPDGYMRMASVEIDAYTRSSNAHSSDSPRSDDPSNSPTSRRKLPKKQLSMENKLWRVLLKQRRFFSFRSSSSSVGSQSKSE